MLKSRIKVYFQNKNSKEVKNLLNSRRYSIQYDTDILKLIPDLKKEILEMSRKYKNRRFNLNFMGLKSNISSPEVIRKVILEMINNNEINAQFDHTHQYFTFY